jgi:hypothetical protein
MEASQEFRSPKDVLVRVGSCFGNPVTSLQDPETKKARFSVACLPLVGAHSAEAQWMRAELEAWGVTPALFFEAFRAEQFCIDYAYLLLRGLHEAGSDEVTKWQACLNAAAIIAPRNSGFTGHELVAATAHVFPADPGLPAPASLCEPLFEQARRRRERNLAFLFRLSRVLFVLATPLTAELRE